MSNTPDFVKKVAGAAREFAEVVADKAEDAFELISDKAEVAVDAARDKMRQTPHLERVKEMYGMIGQGQLMEAFEKYYHDDVVMQEPNAEPRKGKDVNREYHKKFVASVKEMHDGGIGHVASNEDDGVTMIESWMDVTFQDGNRVKMEEVCVQKWEDEKIIHERFYYTMPG